MPAERALAQAVGYKGHKFPIVVGEVGSKFESALDNQSLADMAAWFQGSPNTGKEHPAVSVCPLPILSDSQFASTHSLGNL